MSKHFLLATCLTTVILGACSHSETTPSTTAPATSGTSTSEPELPPENIPQPPPLVVEPKTQGEKSMSSTPQVELKLMPSGDAPQEQKTENSNSDQNLATPLPKSNIPQTAVPNTNLPGNNQPAVPVPANNNLFDDPIQVPQTGTAPLDNPIPQTNTPNLNAPVNSIPQIPRTQGNSPAIP